jgi:hypothetical protein
MNPDHPEKTLVDWALQLLVQHYQQEVHVIDEIPPYFDSLLGNAPKIPSTVELWLYRWQDECVSRTNLTPTALVVESTEGRTGDGGGCDHRQITRYALGGYLSFIRPVLLNISSSALNPTRAELKTTGVPVLQFYELLLSQWFTWCHHGTGVNDSPPTSNQGIIPVDLDLIQIIASDIDLLTSTSTSHDASSSTQVSVSKYTLSNIVIPTLMQVLHFNLAQLTLYYSSGKWENDDVVRTVLRRCLVSALAFGAPRLGLDDVWSSLSESFDNTLQDFCSYTSPASSVLFPRESNWWSRCQLNGANWDDPVIGVATRQSMTSIWMAIFEIMQGQEQSKPTSKVLSNTSISSDRVLRLSCCSLLGMRDIAAAVRAHFFGRDMIFKSTDMADVAKRTRLHLGQRVLVSLNQPDDANFEKPYKWIVSRLHVALQFVALLQPSDVTSDILEQILPILYELISAPNLSHNAFGAAGLAQLLTLMQASQDKGKALLLPFLDSMLPVLMLSIQTCREGVPLALLCKAQSMVFACVGDNKREERLRATQELLIIVDKNNHRYVDPEGNMLLWGVLTGGVIPLLFQLADCDDLDGVEVGRLGLHALLPLLQCYESLSLDAATLVALTNLMMAAYPIMPRHGGKIMCSLLTSCAEHERNASIQNDNVADGRSPEQVIMSELYRHTATVAFALCGERASEIVLELQDESLYEAATNDMAKDVQDRFVDILAREQLYG